MSVTCGKIFQRFFRTLYIKVIRKNISLRAIPYISARRTIDLELTKDRTQRSLLIP